MMIHFLFPTPHAAFELKLTLSSELKNLFLKTKLKKFTMLCGKKKLMRRKNDRYNSMIRKRSKSGNSFPMFKRIRPFAILFFVKSALPT